MAATDVFTSDDDRLAVARERLVTAGFDHSLATVLARCEVTAGDELTLDLAPGVTVRVTPSLWIASPAY
jgi:hypothetical protein